ncbi:DUF1906 domain-containing protein [Ligilactobacillus murinus]|nr:DUF1906 domain-containing protein [Ligilactobacillus murinus]
MTDQKVLETQKWLNATYGNVTGFEKAPENGHTGWKTIYSLREALQHELGLSQLGEGFGDATKGALVHVITEVKPGYKGKIAKLIKGAFWCKGISSGEFDESYDADLDKAVKALQGYAGLPKDGILTVNLTAALFDMSAFVLVEGGDPNIRKMQQDLNARFSNELGVMPCDGIYQRDTNKALIYALQCTVGMSAEVANGNYGPGTVSLTPTVSSGTTGYIVQIIQYGLYVNGFYKGNFDGNFNDGVVSGIIEFRKFMNLPPFSAVADLTLIKGLLTSNGNTDRDSNTCDASTQLTKNDIANFKRFGFDIVGRYLTGTVGSGENERPKNLTISEIKRIAEGGLRLFPIYEDGGYTVEYFTSRQGVVDANIASQAARELGFPSGTTIYFAIDVDVQEGEIGSGIVPYITSLLKTLKYTEYEVGIYGTRNVCLHGEKLGVKKSFVADMSYGWSGNLGFKMPKNWAFDQFSEYPIGGTPIDQDASSGRDKGVVITDFPKGISRNEVLKKISKIVSAFGVEFGKKITISVGVLDVTLEAKAAVEPKDGAIFAIKNGKFDSASIDTWLKKTFGFSSEQADLFIQKCGEITFVTKIDVGNVIFENSIDPDGKLVASMTINIQKYEGQYLDESLALVFGLKLQLPNFPHLDLSSEVSVELPEVSKETLKNGILATTLLVVVIVLICSGVEEVALIAEVLSKLFTPLRYAV